MPSFAEVRAVFFDAVGTLIHPEPSAATVYLEVGRRHGSRRTLAEIAASFAASFARAEALDLSAGLRTDEEREQLRWQRIVAEVLDDVTDPAECFAQLYRHFSLPQAWRCEADVGMVLQELAARGRLLGVASNYDWRLRSVVAGLPALGPLKELVISSEVGWRKPAPEFFAAVCKRTGLPARAILLVGDDRVNDYEGARACGMSAVLLDPRGAEPEVRPRITRLGELLDLLP
jgi:putative hydrolase of the HAD superfamily